MKTLIKAKKANFLVIVLCLFLVSCNNESKNRVYEEYRNFDSKKWERKNVLKFEFDIKDANKKYHIFYNLRNMRNYPYYNLYVNYSLKDPKGKVLKSDIQEMYLFDPITGKPDEKSQIAGSTGDITHHRYMCFRSFQFPKPGKYTFEVKQKMRDFKELPEIISFGLRIEEAEK